MTTEGVLVRSESVRELKVLGVCLALSAAFVLIVLGCFAALPASAALGLPSIVGVVAMTILILLAVASGIVALVAWWIFRRIREVGRTERRIAELDRTVSDLRGRPGEDAAFAAAMEEKVWGLLLTNSVPEAKEVQAELVRFAAASSDAAVFTRVDEFRHMLDAPADQD